jgi:3',5'-cyclic AMP phosphodiesterase CpdA
MKDYLGLDWDRQGQWDDPFFYIHITDTLIGRAATAAAATAAAAAVAAATAAAIAAAGATAAAAATAASARAAAAAAAAAASSSISSSGSAIVAATAAECEYEELQHVRACVSHINRLRPRFVVVTGNLTSSQPGSSSYESEVTALRTAMAKVSETIPVLYCPGETDVGHISSSSSSSVSGTSSSTSHSSNGASSSSSSSSSSKLDMSAYMSRCVLD